MGGTSAPVAPITSFFVLFVLELMKNGPAGGYCPSRWHVLVFSVAFGFCAPFVVCDVVLFFIEAGVFGDFFRLCSLPRLGIVFSYFI